MKRIPAVVQNIGMVGILTLGLFLPGVLEMTMKDGSASLLTESTVAVRAIPFMENNGQFDEEYLFGGSFSGGSVGISETSIDYHVMDGETPVELREFFIDTDGEIISFRPEGSEKSSGVVNYYRGTNEAEWKEGQATYTKVSFGELYAGITAWVTLYNQEVEKVFEVAPGRNPRDIRMVMDGAYVQELHVTEKGELLVNSSDAIRMSAPYAWQYDAAGQEIAVDVAYRIDGKQIYGFQVGAYDVTQPLFIDPILISRVIPAEEMQGNAVAQDADGNIYIVGNMGTTLLSMDNTNVNNGTDGVILKFASDLTFLSGTYLGGSNSFDYLTDLVIDGDDIYIVGQTWSSDFAGTPNGSAKGYIDAILVHVDTNLELQKSLYIGGTGYDNANGITMDASGNIYIVGFTESTGITFTAGSAYGGARDGFIAQVDSNFVVQQFRYIGGTSQDTLRDILWEDGVLYVVGGTYSSNIPLVSPAQPTRSGSQDMFVAALDATNFSIITSTYLGGSGSTEEAVEVAYHHDNGDIYLVGKTDSTNFPQANTLIGVVTARLDAATLAPVVAYVVPDSTSSASDIRVLQNGNIASLGGFYTYGGAIPVTDGAVHGGASDLGLVIFTPELDAIVHATYVGGNANEYAGGMMEMEDGTFLVTGYTSSVNYPVTDGVLYSGNGFSFQGLLTRVFFLDGVSTLDVSIAPNLAMTAGKHVYEVTSAYPLEDGFQVVVTIPEDFGGMDSLTASDIAVTGTHITGFTAVVDEVAHTITITFAATDTFTEFTVEVGDGLPGGKNDLITPAELRSYPIIMNAYHKDGGNALWSVTAGGMSSTGMYFGVEILEALLMTIHNTGIHLVVDPLHNNGKDASQYTELTVRSNAENGYSIYVSLRDEFGLAQLSDGKGNAIASGTGENNFGYMARNAEYGSGTVVDADAAFTHPSQAMYSDGSRIGNSSVTSGTGDTHTVYYDLDVDFLPPAGEYTGVITYTVIGDF